MASRILPSMHALGELGVLGCKDYMRLGNIVVIRLAERLHWGGLAQFRFNTSSGRIHHYPNYWWLKQALTSPDSFSALM